MLIIETARADLFEAAAVGHDAKLIANTITADRLRELLPEAADLNVTRYLLPNIRSVNFVIDGILGKGVAYQARFDPQAKGLGEWLRSRHVDIPEEILEEIV